MLLLDQVHFDVLHAQLQLTQGGHLRLGMLQAGTAMKLALALLTLGSGT